MKKLWIWALVGVLLAGGVASAQAVQATRAERLMGRLGRLTERLATPLTQIENLLNRVKDRIAKMEAAGKDVVAAKEKLPAAESALAKAKTEVENLKTRLEAVGVATKPAEVWPSVKGTLEPTAKLVRSAHQAVVDVIRALKPAARPNQTATSTI